jgi:hypothetical protein
MPERRPEARVVLALEWANADYALKKAKADEGAKRAELVKACFPDGLVEGTNRAELAGGYVVKAVVTPRPKIPDIPLLKAAIAKLEAVGEAGKLLAQRLVKWKPELSVGEWKKLEPKHRAMFAKAVSIEPSGPAVELIEPS